MSDCSSINCYIDQYYDLLLEQMHLKISNNTFPFKIYNSSNKGKHIHSTMILNENTEILQEVPFICWPIKSSFGSIKDISFCENCMKIRNSENSDTFLSYSDLNIEKELCSSYCYNKCVGISRDDNKPELFNGWGFYIQGKTGLNMLRDYQTRIDPNYNLPITIEAISRCIAQLAADIHFFWSKLGKICDNINNAFNLGCKSVENLIAPPVTFFPEINLELVTEYINIVMFNRMKEVFPNEVIHALLGRSTVEQILGQLVLNSQGLNIWGRRSLNIPIYNSQISNNIQCNDEIGIIKAACICTIQSCFNHSCEPNCYVHAIDDATVVVTTNKEILLGEELTISYIDNTLDYESRKSLLKNYHFECTCNLCRRQQRSRPNKIESSDPKKAKYIMIE